MKVGDLVRPATQAGLFNTGDPDWIGVIVDFHVRVDNFAEPQERFAVVCWNADFPQEVEYPECLEVISEAR
jgi:hypothetical protein